MTTSRSVSKSSSMFGISRRPSVGSTSAPPSTTSTPAKANVPPVNGPPVASATSPQSGSITASPISEEDSSPTHRKSNNDKIQRQSISAKSDRSSFSSHGASAGKSESEHRTAISTSLSSSSLTRKLVRSPTADPSHRAVARDFSLSGGPSSSLLHENCSSLRDQFIKIKERFSPPNPLGSPPSKGSPASDFEGNSVDGEKQALRLSSAALLGNSGSDAEDKSSDKNTLVMAIPTERVLLELNERTKRLSAGDLLWPQHSHVERWFVEDNYFKGSMTCWTIERGSEIIARITRVLSERASPTRINPDISLQWIGRQLWAVTVSLPLTRSGELTNEHAVLARLIDEAIAEEVKRAPQDCGPRNTERMNPLLSSGEAPASTTNQVTQKISSGSETSAPVSEQVRVPEVAPSESPSAEPADSPDVSEDIAASANATNDFGSDKRAVASGSSVSTVVVEEESREESITRTHTANEEADVLTALPLSISMLSFSSLQSGADGTASLTDPKGDDACAAPDKTGWLKKKDGWNSWQTRYFELKSNRLYYFASESEGIPRGAIVLDHVHVLRGKGEHSMTFTITASNKSQHLEIIKFSSRMTHQIHPRKSCVLRVVQETEDNVSGWVTALNRASFYCNLSTNTSASGSGSVTSQSQSQSSSSPGRKKKTPFYRLRSPSSSASSVADDDNRQSSGTIDSASYHHFGSVKYLQETDPLLWEIHPHDQQKIRKKAAKARTRSDYVAIFTKYSSTFRQIFLPRPRPITIEQTLRDILPELFLINNVLYGGGDENNSLENIFEVLDGCIKKFASAQEERVRAVSSLLQACARTISGGDSYFVVHSLLGNPSMIIRPAEARGHPIEIEVSATNPHQICITVFSVFSFHHIEDVENYGDGEPGGSAAMPEPLLRIHTYHVQEFDFASGKSSRWLRIRADGVKEDNEGQRTSWVSKRNGSETGFGALLDALS